MVQKKRKTVIIALSSFLLVLLAIAGVLFGQVMLNRDSETLDSSALGSTYWDIDEGSSNTIVENSPTPTAKRNVLDGSTITGQEAGFTRTPTATLRPGVPTAVPQGESTMNTVTAIPNNVSGTTISNPSPIPQNTASLNTGGITTYSINPTTIPTSTAPTSRNVTPTTTRTGSSSSASGSNLPASGIDEDILIISVGALFIIAALWGLVFNRLHKKIK